MENACCVIRLCNCCKVTHLQATKTQGRVKTQFNSFLPMALYGGKWYAVPAALLPEKDLSYPWYRRLGWPQSRSGSSSSAGNQTAVPQLTRPKPSQYSALQTLANRQTTRCRLHTDRNLQAIPDRDSHSTARPPVPVLHRHIRYDQTV